MVDILGYYYLNGSFKVKLLRRVGIWVLLKCIEHTWHQTVSFRYIYGHSDLKSFALKVDISSQVARECRNCSSPQRHWFPYCRNFVSALGQSTVPVPLALGLRHDAIR